MPAQPTDGLLRDLFEHSSAFPLSFEISPARTAAGKAVLDETVARLSIVAPAGYSVTMGAGGSDRTGTHQTAVEIARLTGAPVTAHLVALGQTGEEVCAVADALWEDGVTRILALRGDPPRDGHVPPGGYAHADELVAALRARHDFEIGVAAYPEKHPEASSLAIDIDYLKQKLDAGATHAVCQFVLDAEFYGRFREECEKHGVDVPIVPGLMPLDTWPQIRRFAVRTGTSIPRWLDELFAGTEDTPEIARLIAVSVALEQTRRLIAYGAPAIHVYTLNRWQLPLAIAYLLGRRRP